ncbi:sulfotransferase family protein [Sessilibacter sp. MAH1]
MHKIFIVGLPRTGTTSMCQLFLQLNYSVAHTSYSQACIEKAQVIADTPIFSDFYELNKFFPNSIWIYLHRDFNDWLPSIALLLKKITQQPARDLHPLLHRSLTRVFGDLYSLGFNDEKQQPAIHEHLHRCYINHYNTVKNTAKTLNKNLLEFQLTPETTLAQFDNTAANILSATLKISNFTLKNKTIILATQKSNSAGKINTWNELKHDNKISSHLSGDQRRHYYDYSPTLAFFDADNKPLNLR